MRTLIVLFVVCAVAEARVAGQNDVAGLRDAAFSSTQVWKIGIILTAQGGPSRGVFACTPIPEELPEQRVRIVNRDISPDVRLKFRNLGSGARQMVVNVPRIAAGDSVRAVLTFEVSKRTMPAPVETADYQPNRRTSRDLQSYLRPSPFIESQHPEIVSLARTFERPSESTWSRIESMYDWVRQNVSYVDSELKGALAALRDGDGDCEEMTSLFVAVCRANGIPARTVWVPGHCYPEFYLLDAAGQGHWFPCQAAGDRAFGELAEPRPILQKGDSFRVPGDPQKQPLRYAQLVGSRPGSALVHPHVEIVHQQVSTDPTAETTSHQGTE